MDADGRTDRYWQLGWNAFAGLIDKYKTHTHTHKTEVYIVNEHLDEPGKRTTPFTFGQQDVFHHRNVAVTGSLQELLLLAHDDGVMARCVCVFVVRHDRFAKMSTTNTG